MLTGTLFYVRKKVFLVRFSLTFPRFPRKQQKQRKCKCRLTLTIDQISIFNSFTWNENFSSVYSNRGEISAQFMMLKFLHIIVILLLHCCCLPCEIPANISTFFQCCRFADIRSPCRTTSNQHFNVRTHKVEQHRINVVYFNVDMNNVRQHRNKVVKITILKKNNNKKTSFQTEYTEF